MSRNEVCGPTKFERSLDDTEKCYIRARLHVHCWIFSHLPKLGHYEPPKQKRTNSSDESGIRTHAPEETRSLVWRLRPLGHLAFKSRFIFGHLVGTRHGLRHVAGLRMMRVVTLEDTCTTLVQV